MLQKKYVAKPTEEERLRVFRTIDEKASPKIDRQRCNILLLADERMGKPLIRGETAARCGVIGCLRISIQ